MRYLFGLLFAITVMASTAHADDSYSCKRYKSKCTGDVCYQLAQGLQRDTEKKILTATTTETVRYDIHGDQAKETVIARGTVTVANTGGKMETHYEQVTTTPENITMQNRSDNGQISEKAIIDTESGFYTYYALSNDGTIKDVPIGAPYAAYFGWCDVPTPAAAPAAATTTAAPAVAAPTAPTAPTAPAAPATSAPTAPVKP